MAVTEVVWMRATGDYYAHNEFSPHLSTVKDLVYGFADITTKAGLALLAFLRATR